MLINYVQHRYILQVVKDIQERKATTSFNNTEEKKNTRTVSRFKMERVGNAK